MRLPIVPVTLTAGFFVTPLVVGYAPALAQDFSITNPVAPIPAPAFPGRPDLMRQLQAWWDVHAYYPKHASNNDEGGTVKLQLNILPDGRVWAAKVEESSESDSLDAAAVAVFKGAFVTPAPAGTPEANPEISLHYVLVHRHDQPVAVGYKPMPSRRPFTIANDPVTSPILDTMMQRTCTGEVVKEGIRHHPWYGQHVWVQAVFFRKPDDGTPWVKFYDGGQPLLAPVNEVGKMVQWTGRAENPRKNVNFQYQYTVWADGDNKLSGNIEAYFYASETGGINTGGTVDLTCATEVVPAIQWSALSVRAIQAPPGDPP